MIIIRKIFPLILMVFITLLFCLFTIELIVRVFYDSFSNYNLEMWRYSKELKIPLENDNLPFVHLPGSSAFLYGTQITTDSSGFRVNDYTLNSSENSDKILFLGDSFTLGWGVPYDSTFSHILEKWFSKENKKIRSINAGCGNYNTIMEVELFKIKGVQLNPKIVVLVYYINDIEDTPKRLSSFRYYVMTNFYLYGYLFDKYAKLKSKYDIGFKNNYYSTNYTDRNKKYGNVNAITELANICKRENIKLLVVNIPDLRKLDDYPYSFATEHIKQTAISLNIEFLDLYHSIKSHKPENLWVSPEDPHANSIANYIFALAMMNKLNELGWIK